MMKYTLPSYMWGVAEKGSKYAILCYDGIARDISTPAPVRAGNTIPMKRR